MKWKIVILFGAGFVIYVAFFGLVPRSFNCGGNSAALSTAIEYARYAFVLGMDNPDRLFRISENDRKYLAGFAQDTTWLKGARFLVYTNAVLEDKSAPRRLIIVCDTTYRNVPRRQISWWIIPAPPTHAAGYSDGTAGLISPKEFAALDRSSFAFLDEIYPRK